MADRAIELRRHRGGSSRPSSVITKAILEESVRDALKRSEVIISTGGLDPLKMTSHERSSPGSPVVTDARLRVLAGIRERFASAAIS